MAVFGMNESNNLSWNIFQQPLSLPFPPYSMCNLKIIITKTAFLQKHYFVK